MTSWLAIGMVCFAATAGDSPVAVRVTLEPPEIPFHRQARYSIIVEAPAGLEVEIPDVAAAFGDLPVHDIQREFETLQDGRRRIIDSYILDPIHVAIYPIAPVAVQLGIDEQVVVASPALRVRDLTEAEQVDAMHFAANAVPIASERSQWLWGMVWMMLAVLGGGAGMFYLMHRRLSHGEAVSVPSAWERARVRLDALKERGLTRPGGHEAYYVELSGIVRDYIEERFMVHAPEQTTPEFLASAASHAILSETHRALLAHFLRHCDKVKFARYQPAGGEMKQAFGVVSRFVEETMPRPVSETEEAVV